MRLEDIPVEKDETADKVFRKGENKRKYVQIYLVIALIVPIESGTTINVIKPTRHAAVS